jgi:hypothetical protein
VRDEPGAIALIGAFLLRTFNGPEAAAGRNKPATISLTKDTNFEGDKLRIFAAARKTFVCKVD